MEELYVNQDVLHELMYGAMFKAVTFVPRDVREAFQRALEDDPSELTKRHLQTT